MEYKCKKKKNTQQRVFPAKFVVAGIWGFFDENKKQNKNLNKMLLKHFTDMWIKDHKTNQKNMCDYLVCAAALR